jgi:predicted ATP-grasp superfamily ATP-dependent carboligase
MKVLVHEWCCSGGLAGRVPGEDFENIAREGRSMLEALAADAAKDASLDVTVLVDASQDIRLPTETRVRKVTLGNGSDDLVDASVAADWTIIVAPETAGLLADLVARVRTAGGRVIAPSGEFISIAADKQAAVLALAAAGIPVPAGRSLDPGAGWPEGFHVPAVRKARAGVGCDELVIVAAGDQHPAPAKEAARLEAFLAGTPVGVSCLCGPAGINVLPPVRQRFSGGAAPRYLGGSLPCDALLAVRAERLARRAVEAVSRASHCNALGWVGVDMILGDRDDGRGDRVLEVNPRLTTSFVGLAALFPQSLVRAMIDAAEGRLPQLAVAWAVGRALEFEAAGRVRVNDGSG